MKTVPLQLLTVRLEDGRTGVFIGVPFLSELDQGDQSQIHELWFSDIQQLPADLMLRHLLAVVAAQTCRASSGLQ